VPDLLAALRRDGHDLVGVRVRVQVPVGSASPPLQPARALSRAEAAPLADLARRLPAGPLRAAVQRLLRHSGGGR
jgi:hypothetical protein